MNKKSKIISNSGALKLRKKGPSIKNKNLLLKKRSLKMISNKLMYGIFTMAILFSSPSFSSVHLDTSYICIYNEVVERVKQAGNNVLRFKLRSHDASFSIYYDTGYDSGRAILKLLQTSMNTGLPIFADNNGSSCNYGNITNVMLTTNQHFDGRKFNISTPPAGFYEKMSGASSQNGTETGEVQ